MKHRCELSSDEQLRDRMNASAEEIKPYFPAGIAQPALRALAKAGYTRLEQLRDVDDNELSALHGMGPKAIAIVRDALRENERQA